jgi:hypothetical protein
VEGTNRKVGVSLNNQLGQTPFVERLGMNISDVTPNLRLEIELEFLAHFISNFMKNRICIINNGFCALDPG